MDADGWEPSARLGWWLMRRYYGLICYLVREGRLNLSGLSEKERAALDEVTYDAMPAGELGRVPWQPWEERLKEE